MSKATSLLRLLVAVASVLASGGREFGGAYQHRTHPPRNPNPAEDQREPRARAAAFIIWRAVAARTSPRLPSALVAHRYYERFHMSSFAEDITAGDITAGEDPIVRQAAIDALGNMNGTVVAIEPTSGRVLAMVNQKLALSSGAQPCSTIKLSVALAALSEGLVSKETQVALGGR